MTVKELIKKLIELDQDQEIFCSGLDKSFEYRSLSVIRKVEDKKTHIVIVA